MLTKTGRLAAVSGCMMLSLGLMSGCKSDVPATPAPILDAGNLNGADPSNVNNAPLLDSTGQYVTPGQTASYPQSATYPETSARRTTTPRARVLGQREYPPADSNSGEEYQGYDPSYDSNIDDGQEAIYANQAPPPLPVYEQPELTQPGYEWTPGYWNYASAGYYWVPGAWVPPPYQNALWTPGYWGYADNRYRFHRGFWGQHVGFYGGIPYGFGYTGDGYHGGYWRDNNFYYNRSVNRINVVNVRNVYERQVTIENVGNRYSFNGPGGIGVRPQPYQLAAFREQRTPAVAVQINDRRLAETNRQQFYAVNRGRPQNVVRQENFQAAYRPTAVGPVNRGGFGGQIRQGQQQQVQQQQRAQQDQQQQRAQQDQQRAAQNQQRGQQQQQRAQQQTGRAVADQQQGQQQQQRAQQVQQREQANQQNTQQQQQRAQQQQQRAQQLQLNAQQNQQRAEQQQQRSQQNQQRAQDNQQRAQQQQLRSQQTQQRAQATQQQASQQQQRAQQQQQAQQQQHAQQQQQAQAQRATQQQLRSEQQQQRQAQPRAAVPAAQPAPQQRAAPAPAAQQAPHEEHGGGRPRA